MKKPIILVSYIWIPVLIGILSIDLVYADSEIHQAHDRWERGYGDYYEALKKRRPASTSERKKIRSQTATQADQGQAAFVHQRTEGLAKASGVKLRFGVPMKAFEKEAQKMGDETPENALKKQENKKGVQRGQDIQGDAGLSYRSERGVREKSSNRSKVKIDGNQIPRSLDYSSQKRAPASRD